MTSINIEVAAEGPTFNQDPNRALVIWRRRIVGCSGVFSSVRISYTNVRGHFDTTALASALSVQVGALKVATNYEATATDACNEDKLPAAAAAT